jgi:flavin reductase (DIM6/NTAB) family NADH-FMN oxidoreductase RutF
MEYEIKDLNTMQVQQILQNSIGPRPIAFASTIDKDGNPNLSPFSFFNVFSAAPPILIFSPARRVRDNTTKHTLENVIEVPEVVINVVNFSMVEQTSLSSTEYPKQVNEFEKAGFTAIESDLIRPYRVKESPVQFECKVNKVMALGNEGGAGNLIFCEVLKVHIHDNILNENKQIDPFKLDLVARMGGNWYCRANGAALFEVEKPLTTMGIGVDVLPHSIRYSPILTGNDLGKLGNIQTLPNKEELQSFKDSEEYEISMQSEVSSDFASHRIAKQLITAGKTIEALKYLLING